MAVAFDSVREKSMSQSIYQATQSRRNVQVLPVGTNLCIETGNEASGGREGRESTIMDNVNIGALCAGGWGGGG